MKKLGLALAAGLLCALALAGCGAAQAEAPEEKGCYYEVLDAEGALLCTVTDAAPELDELLGGAGLEDGWPDRAPEDGLYTYVRYQERTRLAGEPAEEERDYAEVLRFTIREEGDTLTLQLLPEAMEGLSAALPQMEGLLTFSCDAPAETAEALRDPARFADETADALAASYYAGQDDRAYRMLQKRIFQSNLSSWAPPALENPVWNYDTFTRCAVLDQAGAPEEQAAALYCCTVSGDGGSYGYVVISYDGDSLSFPAAAETPYLYDLSAPCPAAPDPAPTAAERVRFPAPEGGLAEGIRFTDAQGTASLYRFGESGLEPLQPPAGRPAC